MDFQVWQLRKALPVRLPGQALSTRPISAINKADGRAHRPAVHLPYRNALLEEYPMALHAFVGLHGQQHQGRSADRPRGRAMRRRHRHADAANLERYDFHDADFRPSGAACDEFFSGTA